MEKIKWFRMMFLSLFVIIILSLASVSAQEDDGGVLSLNHSDSSGLCIGQVSDAGFVDDVESANGDVEKENLGSNDNLGLDDGSDDLADDFGDLQCSSSDLVVDGLNSYDGSSNLCDDPSDSGGDSPDSGDGPSGGDSSDSGDAPGGEIIDDDSSSVINLTAENIHSFFRGGKLRQSDSNSTFSIVEDLSDLGILTILASNVTINGNNHTLRNTAFCIGSYVNNVTLNNFTLDVDTNFEDNENAIILIWKSDDVNLFNININQVSPENVDAYAIYSLANQYRSNENLKIVNCSINFTANNIYGGRAYAVRLEHSPDAVFSNNVVDAYLPLHTVGFVGTTAVLDSELVLAVGVSYCDNLTFDNNTVCANVNAHPACDNPTLDGIFICDSVDCRFTNNRLSLYDNVTAYEQINYLYGLDVYRTDNMLIEHNDFHVETIGGTFGMGTAYPIQITGPASDVMIRFNEIFSKSNGPNIGIYSQNYNGANFISILNNHINITGWAGNHSWALVAGIESQDDNDVIMNNLIEVHNTHEFSKDNNIYGISYSQSTDSVHSYRVINNTVISDGYYLSYMLDADNTTVTNNTLVRTDKYSDTDYDPFRRGDSIGSDTDGVRNNSFSGNRVITIFEHALENQDNEIDGGEEFHYDVPGNVNNYTNNLNGSGIKPVLPGFPGGNPLVPSGDGHSAFNTGDYGNGAFPDLSGDDGGSLSTRHFGTDADVRNSFSNHGTSSNSFNGHAVRNENSSSSNPSIDGVSSSGSSRSTGSSAGASGTAGATEDLAKAYEIEERDVLTANSADLSQMLLICLAVLMLVAIGYKRQKDKEEEE